MTQSAILSLAVYLASRLAAKSDAKLSQSGSAIHDLRSIELAELAEIVMRMRACHST